MLFIYYICPKFVPRSVVWPLAEHPKTTSEKNTNNITTIVQNFISLNFIQKAVISNKNIICFIYTFICVPR